MKKENYFMYGAFHIHYLRHVMSDKLCNDDAPTSVFTPKP